MKLTSLLLTAALVLSTVANAATKEEERVANAADVIDQILRIPEQTIPPNLLSRAYGVAVIPNVVKIGFGLGARRGKGILVVRQGDGSWSNPAFVTITGGSIGWQIGAQSTDIILVFKTRQSVDGIANGKLTLGADASIAAGPVGRQAGVATDLAMQAEVVSYSRSRGLFAGVALEGAGVTMDKRANAAFYGTQTMEAEQVFASSPNIAPDVANDFVQLLTRQTSRLPKQPGMQTGTSVGANAEGNDEQADESESEVKTFAMPDP